MPDPESTDNPEFKIVLGLIRDSLKKDPTKWTKYAKALQGAPPHRAAWLTDAAMSLRSHAAYSASCHWQAGTMRQDVCRILSRIHAFCTTSSYVVR